MSLMLLAVHLQIRAYIPGLPVSWEAWGHPAKAGLWRLLWQLADAAGALPCLPSYL